jgi:DNA-binding CsgD family transcriptional regulator
MLLIFCVPAFFPSFFTRLLSKNYFRRSLFAVLLFGAALCFLLIMRNPQFLYSGTLAFLIGIFLALVVCFWISVFMDFSTRELLLYMPVIFFFSIVVTAVLLLLPEPYHEYAVLLGAFCSVILGSVFRHRTVENDKAALQPAAPSEVSRQSLIQILLITAGIGISSEVIRVLAFDKLYESPDALYMTFCVVTFLALLTALCFALYRLQGNKSRFYIAILALAVLLLSISASLFTWLGHQGLFVLMGNIAILLGSLLLPLLFARRKSLVPVQVVGIAQFGLSLGILLGYLSKGLILLVDLSLEIQITALFLSVVLLGIVLLTTIFGLRQNVAQASQAVLRQTPAATPVRHDFATHLAEKGLTARQAEIAVLIAKGYSVPSIAEELVISKKTVENHMVRVYKVLDIHNKQDLIKYYQAFS